MEAAIAVVVVELIVLAEDSLANLLLGKKVYGVAAHVIRTPTVIGDIDVGIAGPIAHQRRKSEGGWSDVRVPLPPLKALPK